MATGWDNGLCQDYCRGLSLWFSSRLDARHTIRKHLMTQPNTQAPADERESLPKQLEQEIFNEWMEAACLHVDDDGYIQGEPTDDDVRQLMRVVHERAALASQPAQAETVVPDGWVPLRIEYEPGYPEDVAFGPQRMMDRLKKWLDRYFEMRLSTPPQAQPAPVAVDERALRDQCKQAWLNEPDDCTILEAYDRGWKDGYKHGAWAAAPAATVQAGQGVIRCQAKLKNGGVCPHHNLQCGWPDCNKEGGNV